MPTLGDGVLTTSWIPGSSYGTYFCRCSTLEFLPFLPKNAVPEKKMPLWEIVRARGRVFSPFGRVLSPFGRAFSPQKNGFGINISEEILVCPKRSFLCKTYLLSKRQKLSPFWRGRYIYISYVCVWVRVCLCMFIYIQYIIKPHFQTCPCEIWVLWFACCERTFLWRLSTAALDTGRHTGVCLNRTDADVSGRKCLAGDVARPSIAIRSWIWKPLKIAPGNNLQIWKW